jgi:serine/threonine protein kinase
LQIAPLMLAALHPSRGVPPASFVDFCILIGNSREGQRTNGSGGAGRRRLFQARHGGWLRGRGGRRRLANMFTVVGLGARLGDRYVLIDCIGAGGMGEVWSARDEVLDRVVAVKVLAGPLANDPAFRASIRREAMASARLIHPHVTQVFDFGEQSAGSGVVLSYLVMELVEGDNLHDRLRAGALPWPQAVEVGADVADALEAAHRIGVVHLDIKPDNVMITRAGAKVLDFGIAALAGRQPFAGSGLRVGTPTYSAPERRHDSNADPAADVFSLGVLLYECLVGRPPRRVDSWGDMAVAEAVPVAPVDVPGLPAEVAVAVGQCLHVDSAARVKIFEAGVSGIH